MAIVWQMAGKFREGMLDNIRAEFAKLRPHFDSTKGFLRAQIFANENGRQVQFMTYWSNYEDSVAFFKAQGSAVTAPMAPFLEEGGTVVCSAIVFDYAPTGSEAPGARAPEVPAALRIAA